MDIEKLIEILNELRSSSIKLGPHPSENEVKALMHKYDMLFLGENFSIIYSVELCNYLNTKLNCNITMNELNSLIPDACNMLNISFEELVAINDIGKPNPAINYQITLWK